MERHAAGFGIERKGVKFKFKYNISIEQQTPVLLFLLWQLESKRGEAHNCGLIPAVSRCSIREELDRGETH